jgi:hypothetical protein
LEGILKKFNLIVSLILLTLLLTQNVFASENLNDVSFTDLDETHWAFSGIEKLVSADIIVGYPDGSFKPEGNITRAELVKIVNKIYSYTQKQDATNFTDIKLEDWYYEDVLIAQAAGYINGYPDGTFKPNELITREELCKIIDVINNLVLLPVDKLPTDEISTWATDYVNKVISNRLMLVDENGNFRATEKATRAEACDALAKFLLDEKEDQPVPSPGSGSDDNIEEAVDETLSKVTRRLEVGVIPNLSSEDQIEIVNDIIENIKAYEADKTHDYESAANEVYEKYKQLSDEEKTELKLEISDQNDLRDLNALKDFFFPDTDL